MKSCSCGGCSCFDLRGFFSYGSGPSARICLAESVVFLECVNAPVWVYSACLAPALKHVIALCALRWAGRVRRKGGGVRCSGPPLEAARRSMFGMPFVIYYVHPQHIVALALSCVGTIPVSLRSHG